MLTKFFTSSLAPFLRFKSFARTSVVVVAKVESGAEGGSRTRTSFRTTDFKSRDRAIT